LCKQALSSRCWFFLQKCHDLHLFSLVTCLWSYIFLRSFSIEGAIV
jgi:hypothetical protein